MISPPSAMARVMLRRAIVRFIAAVLLVAGCAFGLPPNESLDGGAGGETPPSRAPSAGDAAGGLTAVPFDLHECSEVHCPPTAPFVVGCDQIVMTGNAQLGCVATLDPSTAAFEQGNLCRSDEVSGRVLCSSTAAAAPLGPDNCSLPRPVARYLTTLSDCNH